MRVCQWRCPVNTLSGFYSDPDLEPYHCLAFKSGTTPGWASAQSLDSIWTSSSLALSLSLRASRDNRNYAVCRTIFLSCPNVAEIQLCLVDSPPSFISVDDWQIMDRFHIRRRLLWLEEEIRRQASRIFRRVSRCMLLQRCARYSSSPPLPPSARPPPYNSQHIITNIHVTNLFINRSLVTFFLSLC